MDLFAMFCAGFVSASTVFLIVLARFMYDVRKGEQQQ